MIDQAFFADWYFHVPNYILAVVMYTLVGRFILSFFFPAGSTNPIFRIFVWITEPAVRIARFLAPAVVPHIVVLVFATLWTMLLRFGLLLAFADGMTSVATG